MSNASLKEQLEAVASQLSDKLAKGNKPNKSHHLVEMVNKKPKSKWLEHAQYGVELLKAHFPESFKSSNEVKPLKKGIKQDLVKRLSTMNIVTEDKACMVKSLAYYVNARAYHKSVVDGAVRIDLDGQPAGTVTSEEAQYSLVKYKEKTKPKQQSTRRTSPTTE